MPSLAEEVIRVSSKTPTPKVAGAIAASNAGLAAFRVPAEFPEPLFAPEHVRLNAAGFTMREGPHKGQVVVADQAQDDPIKNSVNTLAHESYHARVRAAGGMPPVVPLLGDKKISADAIGNFHRADLERRMNEVQPPNTYGIFGLHHSSTAEEQIANVVGYEGSLPKGTSIESTEVGKKLLANKTTRDYYFSRSALPYEAVYDNMGDESLADKAGYIMDRTKYFLTRHMGLNFGVANGR